MANDSKSKYAPDLSIDSVEVYYRKEVPSPKTRVALYVSFMLLLTLIPILIIMMLGANNG